ncbi:MAG: translation initiation factor IF-2 [Bacteroidia bacterium]|nr:translation initiation factor IF-2 [Bacteroidia bacterium]MCX7764173.1 translation initiation factor IF-2 [Bacteroidia bacterium]
MSMRSYKLAQIATEIGVGLQTLAEDLRKLGHPVEGPLAMARISEEVYQQLLRLYGRSVSPEKPASTPPPEPPVEPPAKEREISLPIRGKIELPSKRLRPAARTLATPPPSAPPIPPVQPPQEVSPPPTEEPASTVSESAPSPAEKNEEPLPIQILGTIELKPPPQRKRHFALPEIPTSPAKEEKKEEKVEKTEPLPSPERVSEVLPALEEETASDELPPATKRKRKRTRKKRKEIEPTPPPVLKSKSSQADQRRPVKSQLKSSGDVATRRRFRQEKYKQRERKRELERMEAEAAASTIRIAEYITAAELAKALNVPVNQIIAKCLELGYPTSINQRLDRDLAAIVAEEFGFKVEFITLEETLEQLTQVEESEEDLVPRPPIVTVMGHVDHGKTTLLDYIRNTNVVAGEAGGITQHIGAYEVTLPSGQKITFLDTPGHEAFTAMRARGAQVTDIAIIVVAADDHVRPQTLEALSHAQAANVPIIFAINKIDKDTANPDRIRQELAEAGFLVEEWGGPHPSQLISAKKGTGVNELLEKVLILAELMELKANPNRPAKGTIIEAQLDRARGPVATVLVQTGTLKVGDIILAGQYFGRVRALLDERGKRIDKAGPSQPVQILGLGGVPEVGEKLYVLQEESVAREMAHRRSELLKERERRRLSGSLLEGVASGQAKQLNLIVKADVSGSLEALTDSLVKLSTSEVQVNVIHRGVGQITDSDVLLAKASNALIVGFQVRPSHTARQLAKQNGVEIRLYNVIYDIIDEVKSALSGMLAPVIQEETIGTAEVREIFKIPKVGTVAGCKVIEGKIIRGAKVHLIREGVVLYTSTIASLKRFKDDVKEVTEGFECGLTIEGFQDIKVGDVIECFQEVQVKRSL